MRIHIGEGDKYQGRPLYQSSVELLRCRHYAGATVLRAIMGFGANAHLRTDRVELPEIDRMIGGGLITLERAKVIMYRGDVPPERRSGSWQIDMSEDWTSDET